MGSLWHIDRLHFFAPLDASTEFLLQYAFMNIQVHIEDSVVELLNGGDSSTNDNGYVNGPSFVIVAKRLGTTNLHVSLNFGFRYYIFYTPPNFHYMEPGIG